jgi:hypothetical protein
MDPEEKKMLQEDLALSKDNHRMLRAIRRDAWFALVWKIVFWAALILVPLYLYQQYLKPIVTTFIPASKNATTSSIGSFFGLPSTADLQKLINSFKVK